MSQLQKYAFRFGHALHVAGLTQVRAEHAYTDSGAVSTIRPVERAVERGSIHFALFSPSNNLRRVIALSERL